MQLITEPLNRQDLQKIAEKSFGNLVKAVIDINKKIMVVGASLHADEEALLLHSGSLQSDLWGINLYPELKGEEFIEFDSMINVRPGQRNYSRSIDDPIIQRKIIEIVAILIK